MISFYLCVFCFWLKPIFISGFIILTNNKGHRIVTRFIEIRVLVILLTVFLPPPRLLYI